MGIYMVWQVHRVHWKGQHSRTTTTSTGAVALILTTKKSSGNWSQVPLAKILGFDSATKCYILNSIA